MSDGSSRKRKIGSALFAAGLALTLGCHLLGSWELIRYRGAWRSISSDDLDYDIPCYDARPGGSEVGRVVIYGGFAAGAQVYFPLAVSLLRSGYAVRLAAASGSPNSKVPMSYKSHGAETLAAARPFFEARPDLPHFVMGHSEGTRYAVQTGRKIHSIDGVVLLSTISAEMDAERPSNVLMLVAENDFTNVKRQTSYALMSGTNLRRPEFDRTYGDILQGTARRAQIMPGTNHVSIAFDKASHRSILDWLNQVGGRSGEPTSVGGLLKFPVSAIGVLLGASVAVAGIGLLFPRTAPDSQSDGIPVWAMMLLFAAGWGLAAFFGDSVTFAQKIPLLVYGRILVIFAIATVPLLLVAVLKPKLGAGLPRGSWKARAALLGTTLTLLLFDRWLVGVMPSGRRLFWFGVAFFISGGYLACDEFLRRGVQRATDWQTGFALGLAAAFIAAVAVAGAAFFVGTPVGEFLIAGSVTLFVLLAACEIPATYLYAATGDWLLSWWVRVSILNGFIICLVPLVSEIEFRRMIP